VLITLEVIKHKARELDKSHNFMQYQFEYSAGCGVQALCGGTGSLFVEFILT
jgi:xanthine/CO dehydrogenase XdhC/CoxF family maturation factor